MALSTVVWSYQSSVTSTTFEVVCCKLPRQFEDALMEKPPHQNSKCIKGTALAVDPEKEEEESITKLEVTSNQKGSLCKNIRQTKWMTLSFQSPFFIIIVIAESLSLML